MSNTTKSTLAHDIRWAPVGEMSEEITLIFMKATMMEKCSKEEIAGAIERSGIKDVHTYKVLNANLNVHLPAFEVTENVKMFLVCLCMSSLAKVVMLCAAIAEEVRDKRLTRFSMTELTWMFPNGFPSDETFTQIWDSHKAANHESESM